MGHVVSRVLSHDRRFQGRLEPYRQHGHAVRLHGKGSVVADKRSPRLHLTAAGYVSHGWRPRLRDTHRALHLVSGDAMGAREHHLGDEFTLLAANAFGDDFERINVSYEYWEYGVAYDALFGCTAIPERVTGACHRLTLRHGGIRPHTNKKIGYYSTETLGQNIPPITPSKENYEPSFGFEYRAPHKSGRLPRERGVVVSVDARHKILYDYHKVPADASEERQWSFSVVLGLSQPYGADDIPFDYFLYYYRGVNPHGQFRSRGDYQAFGLGFIFGG